MGTPAKSFFMIEMFDPLDEETLAYFNDFGVWVRNMVDGKHYLDQYKAMADHSVLSQNLLHVRVSEHDPSDARTV